jgi:hypothetical protein
VSRETQERGRWIEGRWLLGVGLLAVAIGFGLFFRAATAGAELITLGILIAALGAVIDRTSKVKVSAAGLEVDLTDRPNGSQFVRAVAQASDGSLASMIPLLCDDFDVATTTIELPKTYDGHTLRDDGLAWLRQELNISVFAVRRPTDPHWRGGGRITEMRLVTGTHLAVAGDPGDLEVMKRRLEGSD